MTVQIAQLVVPSDGLGAPDFFAIDWPRSRLYFGNNKGLRSYIVELATQSPILSESYGITTILDCLTVDPVTGTLLLQLGTSNGEPVLQFDPTSLTERASFGIVETFAAVWPISVRVCQQIVCVGVGTVASSGATQVGYAVLKESVFSGNIGVIRTDAMTQAGFYSPVVSGSVDNRAIMCAGASGPTKGEVFVTWQNLSFNASIPLYAVTILQGAETYDSTSWPATNPFISSATIGSIAASAVDATWTSMAANQIGYDATDGNVILDVSAGNSVAHPRYLIKVSATTAAIIWATAVPGTSNESLQQSSIDFQITAMLTGAGLTSQLLDTATGVLTTAPLTGLAAIGFTATNDTAALIFGSMNYLEGPGSPVPVSGTPSTISQGFAFLSGIIPPPPSPSALATTAELWFSPTAGFVDFTSQANRRLFISLTGGAVDLEANQPFGIDPPVYLSRRGTPLTFAANDGRGGSFAVFGTAMTAGATNPPGTESQTIVVTPYSSGDAILGDYRNGNLYAFNTATLTDNGTQRRWLRRWRALPQATSSAVSFKWLNIQAQSGAVGTPDGTNPQCVLRWSDDGGHTFSDERIVPVGKLGQTKFTIKFNRLGMTRRFSGSDRIFELSSTDPFVVALLDADVDAK